jgi:hypothetical protein
MSKLSFSELVASLTNRELIEQGLCKRDLALASLVAFHDFHLEKAISFSPIQQRWIVLSPDQKIALYPGLDDEQFNAIIQFAYQEKWPLTSKGLFRLLQNQKASKIDETLVHAFLRTPEFYSLQLLFQKTGAAQTSSRLVQLICDGSWELLEDFAQTQSRDPDFSAEKRRGLLLSYLSHKSSVAAQIFLTTDFSFAQQRLEDSSVVNLISLLKEKTPEAERFCLVVLGSPRADLVLTAASERLYAFAGEIPPSPIDLNMALARFSPKTHLTRDVSSAPVKQAVRHHVVADGDNLWKIARQYKIKMDELVRVNELEKDQIYPGMILLIP